MTRPSYHHLSRRERQIMDAIYRFGRATVAEVMDNLPDPPSYSAVRAKLRVLEDKGHVKHIADGPRYVFEPTVPLGRVRQSALHQVVTTFFDGSAAKAAAALLDLPPSRLSHDELNRLATVVAQAQKE